MNKIILGEKFVEKFLRLKELACKLIDGHKCSNKSNEGLVSKETVVLFP